jgi:hypothetical protein
VRVTVDPLTNLPDPEVEHGLLRGQVARLVFGPHPNRVLAHAEPMAEGVAADPQRFLVDLAVEGDR